MRQSKLLSAVVVAALAFSYVGASAATPAHPARAAHKVVVNAECKTMKGKEVDCSKKSCVDSSGKTVAACATAGAAATTGVH